MIYIHLQDSGVGRDGRDLIQLEEHTADGWAEAKAPGRASNFGTNQNQAAIRKQVKVNR